MQKQEPPRKSPRRALGARLTVRAINYTYNDTKAHREEAGGRSDRPEQKDGRKRPFPYRLEPAAPPESGSRKLGCDLQRGIDSKADVPFISSELPLGARLTQNRYKFTCDRRKRA